MTTGTVLEEALVPFLDLCVSELGVGLEVGHHLGPDLAALVIPHHSGGDTEWPGPHSDIDTGWPGPQHQD